MLLKKIQLLFGQGTIPYFYFIVELNLEINLAEHYAKAACQGRIQGEGYAGADTGGGL